jgi:hypothetical protein
MPSRKQRRRQAKARRHEWEEVWVDEEGNEIEGPHEVDEDTSRNGKRTSAASARQPKGAVRNVQPPSWQRVAKRGLIFAPLMFLTVTFLSSSLTVSQRIVNTIFLLAFFLPFSYLMDTLMYRMAQKRANAAGQKR